MCTVSVIMDSWRETLPNTYPWVPALPSIPAAPFPQAPTGPTSQEFDALRKEVQELKELLIHAKKFDEATGQADCETEEKVALLRRIADIVGVDISEVLTQ